MMRYLMNRVSSTSAPSSKNQLRYPIDRSFCSTSDVCQGNLAHAKRPTMWWRGSDSQPTADWPARTPSFRLLPCYSRFHVLKARVATGKEDDL